MSSDEFRLIIWHSARQVQVKYFFELGSAFRDGVWVPGAFGRSLLCNSPFAVGLSSSLSIMSTAITSQQSAAHANHHSELVQSEGSKVVSGDGKMPLIPIPGNVQPSTFRSICLIVACSTAMVVNVCLKASRLTNLFPLCRLIPSVCQIANVMSLSVALPCVSRELNIPEQRLQWPISAYSLSSVRALVSRRWSPHESRFSGLLFASLWSPCGSTRTQENLHYRLALSGRVFFRPWVCKWYFVFFPWPNHIKC